MKNQTAPLGVSSSIDGGQPYGGSLDELYILGWSLTLFPRQIECFFNRVDISRLGLV